MRLMLTVAAAFVTAAHVLCTGAAGAAAPDARSAALTQVTCTTGVTLPHSNRTASAPCAVGVGGDECFYSCDAGYVARGRHVCQTYASQGRTFVNQSYSGGSCQRLCSGGSGSSCPGGGAVPLRVNSTDSEGSCLATQCFESADAVLRHIARGNYEVWRMGRNNRTGMYLDHIHLGLPESGQDWQQAATGVTGLGLAIECLAVEMGWISRSEGEERVMLTLRAIAGQVPGFELARGRRGWINTFVDSNTGSSGTPPSKQTFALMASGLNGAGVLFASTYFNRTDPTPGKSATTRQIVALAHEVHGMIKWDTILCGENSTVSPTGTGIPMLVDSGDGCQAVQYPQADGYYQFNEEHYTVWFAYEMACGEQPAGECDNKAIETMWHRWQGRRQHINTWYGSHPLLSIWSAYLVQLPFFMVHAFNSDPTYLSLFKSHWQADVEYYTSTAYNAGVAGRYGLGAGAVESSCAGTGYIADKIVPMSPSGPNCRNLSPYSVAGYMPASPAVVTQDLLAIVADGDAVAAVPGTPYHVLVRRNLVDPEWNGSYDMTLVDYSSEILGLSTLWVGADWYVNNTRHFPHD